VLVPAGLLSQECYPSWAYKRPPALLSILLPAGSSRVGHLRLMVAHCDLNSVGKIRAAGVRTRRQSSEPNTPGPLAEAWAEAWAAEPGLGLGQAPGLGLRGLYLGLVPGLG